ncbi:MAG TPA: hypothetical protein VK952_04750 [Methylotenera sp.]|nr:hypothetical protein [Methylotenera sp.]
MKFSNKPHASIVGLSIIYALKAKKNQFKALVQLACLWRYRLVMFTHSKFSQTKFYYFGLKAHRDMAFRLLGLDAGHAVSEGIKQRAFISQIPIPGSIRIPHYLTSLIPLKNRSLDEILIELDKGKRKLINKEASDFSLQQVTDINEVARLNQEMLMPYASHRHGKGAYQLPWKMVMKMALNQGALYLLLEKEREVGCVIGCDFFCNNEHCWNSIREGFPSFIFDDIPSRTKKSIIMIYLEIELALNNGYDYYDLGHSQAFAESGALHHKRTYGAKLNARGDYNFFYFRLPKHMAAKFYWEKPVFAVEGKAVVLHLGLPDGVSADEVAERYRLLNYDGLNKVHLHCDSAPSNAHTEAVEKIYSHQKSPPALKVYVLTLTISLSARYAYITQGLFLEALYI